MPQVDLTNAEVQVLMIVDGKVCLVGINKENREKYEGLSLFCKATADKLIDTKRNVSELRQFLGFDKETANV